MSINLLEMIYKFIPIYVSYISILFINNSINFKWIISNSFRECKSMYFIGYNTFIANLTYYINKCISKSGRHYINKTIWDIGNTIKRHRLIGCEVGIIGSSDITIASDIPVKSILAKLNFIGAMQNHGWLTTCIYQVKGYG